MENHRNLQIECTKVNYATDSIRTIEKINFSEIALDFLKCKSNLEQLNQELKFIRLFLKCVAFL